MSVTAIDTDKINKIEEEIKQYMYGRGHNIDRHLIIDFAFWAYGYGNREYMNGVFANDQIQISATSSTTKSTKESPKPKGAKRRLQ